MTHRVYHHEERKSPSFLHVDQIGPDKASHVGEAHIEGVQSVTGRKINKVKYLAGKR